jgi:hypothetical protein
MQPKLPYIIIELLILGVMIWFTVTAHRAYPKGKVNKETLTKREKIFVWVLSLLNPILTGAVFYYSWIRKLHTKAVQANRVSWIALVIWVVLIGAGLYSPTVENFLPPPIKSVTQNIKEEFSFLRKVEIPSREGHKFYLPQQAVAEYGEFGNQIKSHIGKIETLAKGAPQFGDSEEHIIKARSHFQKMQTEILAIQKLHESYAYPPELIEFKNLTGIFIQEFLATIESTLKFSETNNESDLIKIDMHSQKAVQALQAWDKLFKELHKAFTQ